MLVAAITTVLVACFFGFRAISAENERRRTEIRSMGENELYVDSDVHVFYHQTGYVPPPATIQMLGASSKNDHCVVLIATADNITVERRADGKSHRSFRLTGNIGRDGNGEIVSAEGAVILVPANDDSYIRNISLSLLEEQFDARKRVALAKLNEELNKKREKLSDESKK